MKETHWTWNWLLFKTRWVTWRTRRLTRRPIWMLPKEREGYINTEKGYMKSSTTARLHCLLTSASTSRGDGPFKVLAKVNGNPYKIELPKDYAVSPTFNVVDLSPCIDQEDQESRMTPL